MSGIVRARPCLPLRPVAALLLVALMAGLTWAASRGSQASILARVLSYELTLQERVPERIGIAVVYKRDDAASEASAEGWMRGLAQLGSVKIKDRSVGALKMPFEAAELNAAIDKGVAVVVVADGVSAELAEITRVTRSRHVLTVGGTLADVRGFLSVGIADEGEKPKIYINLKAARLEGVRFSNRLLGVATLIR